MMQITATTPNDAYAQVLRYLLLSKNRVSPRGIGCVEERNALITISDPYDGPIVTRDPERNERIARYTRAEFDLYNRGSNSAAEFAKHAPMWNSLANDDGTINSAYGRIIWYNESLPYGRTPWDWAVRSLAEDRDTRQAVLLFMRPDHLKPSKDVVCTCHGTFHIRDDALHFTVVMRSNDAVRGMVYDVPWFCHVMQRMKYSLFTTYGHLRIGTYSHFVHSLHLYDTDVEMARRMLYGPNDLPGTPGVDRA